MLATMVEAEVTIRVVGTDRRPLPKAKVDLEPAAGGKKRSHKLAYDARAGGFRGTVPPGDYVVKAAANGFRADERRIHVGPAGTSDVLILGKPGLPTYYLGKVRVPFDPPRGLIALTLDGASLKRGEAVEERIVEVARAIGLEPVAIPDPVRDDNVRVFKSDPAAVDAAIERLSATPGVRRAGPVLHFENDSVTYLTDELVVRFRDHVATDEVPRIAADLGLTVERRIPYAGNAFLLRGRRAGLELLAALERLARSDLVEYAEPNLVATAVEDFTPNDPQLANQPHHPILGSAAAWDVTLGDNTVTVAVLDSGCDLTHPDFQNPMGAGWTKLVNPFDFSAYDADPFNAGSSHGTQSCGIAAAVTDNAVGIAGLAGGCRLMPLRRPAGYSLVEFSDAYIWAAGFDPGSTTPGFPAPIADGADVISNSFGYPEMALPGIMKDTFDYLTTYGRGGKGCVVVFSVGNDNQDFTTYRYWAAYDRTIAVASSAISPPDPAEVKVSTSNFGPLVDLCAPGGGPFGGTEARTQSTMNGAAYGTFGQTSCACPQVSGTAALMLSVNPDLTWTQVRELLRSTAVQIDAANADPVGQWVGGYSQWYGFGRLDAAAAVAGASTYVAPYDIVIRENLADTGLVVPSGGAFWNSPDIWVRQLSPAAEGAAALPANYATAGPTLVAKSLQDNYVYVRVRNAGAGLSLPFYLRVYLTHFAGTEFVYPDDFVPTTNPGVTPVPPLQPGTYLLGDVAHPPLAGGAESIVPVTWLSDLVPPETVLVNGMNVAWHPCLLAEISPHDGLAATGVHIWDDANLAQKNISIDYPGDDDRFASFVALGNRVNRDKELVLAIDRGKLPRQADLWVRFVDPQVARRVRERLRRQETHQDGLAVRLLDDCRIEVGDADESYRLRLDVPAGTTLTSVRSGVRPASAGVVPAYQAGYDVIRLPYRHRVELPIPVSRGELVGVVVGGDVPAATPPGRYHVGITQLTPEGVATGAAGIEVRVGEKPD